jgi:Carboxypeptidase regulatory-like domain
VGASTDSDGKWNITGLVCRAVQFRASHAGFIQSPYGRHGPVLDPSNDDGVLLTSDSPAHDLKIQLMPESVITGKVLDEAGEPVTGANIRVLQSMVRDGRRVWEGASGGSTDSRGEYRIGYVRPGNYIVCARTEQRGYPTGGGKAFSYGESCYPGFPSAGTRNGMQVAPGREARFDFSLSPLPSARVSGKATGVPRGAQGPVWLFRRNEQTPLNSGAMNQGEFEFVGVAAGAYEIKSNTRIGDQTFFAGRSIEVGSEDLEDVSLPFLPGVPVKGVIRVETRSGQNPRDNIGVEVWLESVGRPMFGNRAVEWSAGRASFTFPETGPGQYKLKVNVPQPYYVKSVTLQDQDLRAKEIEISTPVGPIEIVLANDGGNLEGTVADASGQPIRADVLLIGREEPRMKGSDENGRFKIENIPPGEYEAYSFDDYRNVEYADPEWMRRNAGDGLPVTIRPGRSANVSLVQRIIPQE